MTISLDQHLTYDELIRNLVDRADLGPDRQAHLQGCPQCRRQAEILDLRYNRLGRMARELAPGPTNAFRVPDSGTEKRRRQFRPALAMGMVGFLILGFTIFWPRFFDTAQVPPELAVGSVEEESRLMAQIDALVDDALPKSYQQVLAVSEPVLTEDLIDWIVPSIEEDDGGPEPQA